MVTESIVNMIVWKSNKYKVLHMDKVKLPKRGMLPHHLPLAPTKSLNTTNAYSMVQIKKRSFLMGHELCIVRDL